MLACTFGHAVGDGYANFVPPLWFTVQTLFKLADRDIGLISLLLSTTTNFGQPVFGYLVDRFRLKNTIPLALLVATVFVSAAGFAPQLWMFVACMMISGVGIAFFHPRGGSLAAEASGSRRAFGMGIFGAGGAIGYAVASLGSPLLHDAGLKLGMGPLQGFVLALPLGLAAVWLLWKYNPGRERAGCAIQPNTRPLQPEGEAGFEGEAACKVPVEQAFILRRDLLPHWRPLLPLFLVMVLRSATVTSFTTFIQVLQGKLGHSTLFQGAVLFVFVGGGAVGGIVGSRLSEGYGRRFITIITLLMSLPLLYFSLSSSPLLTFLLLFLAGATLRGAESVNIAQTQDLLPQGMSVASAIAMGLTWGFAGLFPPAVGLLSDATGNLKLALACTIVLPVIAAGIAVVLPRGTEAGGRG
ncbi:MAG: MFS transporter [Armatimonadia bacterium]